ncbi:hypothetical protein PSECIP111854_02528 [Pseudoalteromonas sp. CIP111854]|uniref:Isocitrate lyase/phosphoenolpyruvate mutase family protein n=1 Tax=Pseudoalteromonas holothuriae TaxID=2963714 RepID=A0A9W4QZV2_9GAMM|nr:isocitrate lyase/phosphoenolpyruvate mutase family protein [Pseudoalteromonas sp. CIP111854]CAH9060051.1 hypothetical protein PSECIP111854_02528 [Pseudoalteromonas sp. CIP111854]
MNKYHHFHQLHSQTTLFKLLNAWDPLSAVLLQQGGCQAIGTTSRGMANERTQNDGESCAFNTFLMQTKQIINAVDIGVSVDIESGFSDDIQAICEHVLAIVELGAVGINIEDSSKVTGQLRDLDQQSEILRAIKRTLHSAGFSQVFINARIDTHLSPVRHFTDTLSRAKAYENSGVDGVFVPGIINRNDIKVLSRQLHIPLNILALPYCNHNEQLHNWGVKRLSFGNTLSDNCIDLIQKMTVAALNDQDHSALFQHQPLQLPF